MDNSLAVEQEIVFLSQYFSPNEEDKKRFQELLRLFYREYKHLNNIRHLEAWFPIIESIELSGKSTDYYRVLISTFISYDSITRHFEMKREIEEARKNREIDDPIRRMETYE